MSTTRRDVLRGLGVGALGVLGGVPLIGSRRAFAQTPPYKVLEVFCFGGMSTFQTLFVPDAVADSVATAADILPSVYHPLALDGNDTTVPPNDPNPPVWPVMHDPAGMVAPAINPSGTNYSAVWNQSPWNAAATGNFAAAVAGYFANPIALLDDDGQPAGGVLGPAFAQLAGHPLLARASVVPIKHGVPAHVGGVFLMMNGATLGRPYAAGTGAAVQATYGSAANPAAFVINVGENLQYANFAATTGPFSPANRPPVLVVNNGSDNAAFQASLARTPYQATDPLLAWYADRFEADLGGARSDGFASYHATTRLADHADLLLDRLVGTSLNSAGNTPAGPNPHDQAIKVAVHLLKQSPQAQYSCVVTGGISGFDHHHEGFDSIKINNVSYPQDPLQRAMRATASTTFSLWGVLNALRQAVDSGDLDLSTTLVVLNTEFGRINDGGGGGDHYPNAFGVMLLGGPVRQGVRLRGGGFSVYGSNDIQIDPGPAGALGFEDYQGNPVPVGPGDLRKAISQAAGVPFDAPTAGTGDQWTAFFGPS